MIAAAVVLLLADGCTVAAAVLLPPVDGEVDGEEAAAATVPVAVPLLLEVEVEEDTTEAGAVTAVDAATPGTGNTGAVAPYDVNDDVAGTPLEALVVVVVPLTEVLAAVVVEVVEVVEVALFMGLLALTMTVVLLLLLLPVTELLAVVMLPPLVVPLLLLPAGVAWENWVCGKPFTFALPLPPLGYGYGVTERMRGVTTAPGGSCGEPGEPGAPRGGNGEPSRLLGKDCGNGSGSGCGCGCCPGYPKTLGGSRSWPLGVTTLLGNSEGYRG